MTLVRMYHVCGREYRVFHTLDALGGVVLLTAGRPYVLGDACPYCRHQLRADAILSDRPSERQRVVVSDERVAVHA